MSAVITGQIDLNKIDASRVKTVTRKDGSIAKFYDLTVSVNDETRYGNNVGFIEGQTKEERDAKAPKNYLGNAKVVWTDGNIVEAERDDQQGVPAPEAADMDDDSLPF